MLHDRVWDDIHHPLAKSRARPAFLIVRHKVNLRKYVQTPGRLFTKEEWKRAEGVEYEVATGKWLQDTKELAEQIRQRAYAKAKAHGA